MITAVKYAVSWSYREQDITVRRILYHGTEAPVIEAARLINNNPYTFDVEVIEVDTGKQLDWAPAGIGKVLVA